MLDQFLPDAPEPMTAGKPGQLDATQPLRPVPDYVKPVPEEFARTAAPAKAAGLGEPAGPAGRTHFFPAQVDVPDEVMGWLENQPSPRRPSRLDGRMIGYPDDKHWQTNTDPYAPMGRIDEAKVAEAAAREPNDTVRGKKSARFALAKAGWDLVSRLLPEAAAKIKRVELHDTLDRYTEGGELLRANAWIDVNNGTLHLYKGRETRPDTLYHELIHIEQRMRDANARNYLKPHAERSNDEHMEIEREASSRQGQVNKAHLFDRLREMVNANLEQAGGPLGNLRSPTPNPQPPTPQAEPMPSASRVTGKTVVEEAYARRLARAGGDQSAYEEIRRQKEAQDRGAERPVEPQRQAAAADPAAIDARLRARGLQPDTPAYERAYRDELEAAGANDYNPGEHALPPGEEARELLRGRAMGKQADLYGEAAAGTPRVAAVRGQSPGTVPAEPRGIGSALKATGRGIADVYRRLAGRQLPAMRRVDKDIADAGVRAAWSRVFGQEKADALVKSVFDEALGHKATKEELELYGTAMVEKLRLERIQEVQNKRWLEAWRKAQAPDATPADKAAATRAATELEEAATVIGPDSPIKNQLQLHQVWNSPEMQRILKNWHEQVSPLLDENYKKGQWLEPDKEIEGVETQTPGYTLNLKRFDPEKQSPSPGAVFSGGRRAGWSNMVLRRFPFAKRATGGGAGYETNAAELLKHSLGRAQEAADMNDFYRLVTDKGRGAFDKPGQKLEMNGKLLEEIPLARPKHPLSSFYMDPDLAGEWKQILNVEDKYKVPLLSEAARLPTTAALAGTGNEALAHFVNHLLLPIYPKYRPFDVTRQLVNLIRGDADTQNRVAELARIGAMKARGFEGGRLLPESMQKFDPTHWSGKLLDTWTRATRLAADQMYTRMVDAGQWVDSAEGRRNFVNKFGNYGKTTQSQIVRALREAGLNPFATAHVNFTLGAVERLASPIVGVPGVQHTSTAAALKTRAAMFSKILATAAIGPVINAMVHGRWDGDDNVPILSIKTGDNPDGSSSYIDPFKYAGLRRAMKATGLETAIDRKRVGQKTSTATNAAEEEILKTLSGIPSGPAGQFVHTGFTGKNFSGTQLMPEGTPAHERFLRAAANTNPALSELTESNVPYFVKERPGLGEKAGRALVGPFMPQKARAPRDPEAYRTIRVKRKGG